MKPVRSQASVLMDVLREFLRARGLRTRDIAKEMNVTERTVMRWFASEAADTKIVEQLCALIDIGFFELCEIAARRAETRLTQLSIEQEQALVDYPLMNYLFINILKGWSTEELQSEIEIPEPMFVDALIRLEKIGLISLFPGNEVRLRTAKDVQWRKDGPYSRYQNMFLNWSLAKPNIFEPQSLWEVEPLKLSTGSLAQVKRKFDALRGEIVALSAQDRRTNDMSREWFSLVLAARHIDMTPLSEWPTQYPLSMRKTAEGS
jgi:AcrR family transcriptional regulator